MLSVPQTNFMSAPTSLNRPGLQAHMGKQRLRKSADQIPGRATLWMYGVGESNGHWLLVKRGQSHPFSSPESEALKWVSTTASSGVNIAPHCMTLGQGFSNDQSCIDSSGFSPLPPLCHLPLSASWTTAAPPPWSPLLSPTPSLTKYSCPGTGQPEQSMDTRPLLSWPASPLLEQPQPGPPCTVSGPSLLRRRFQLL